MIATDTQLSNILSDLRHNPVRLIKVLWPDVILYTKQRQIVESVWENDDTFVPAGHKLGKDFITGLIIPLFFVTRTPCRIITTSVDSKQLEGVLWGEIRKFIRLCKMPLENTRGGPLLVNHMHIRKILPDQSVCPLSYIIGRVAARGEGMSGHHLAVEDGVPHTLMVGDEASGVDQQSMDKSTEWAHRRLFIGNPYDCANDFKWAVDGKPGTEDRGGDIPRTNNRKGFRRKVVHITGYDSPNVQLAMKQVELGLTPTYKNIIPGVLSYDELETRLATWDPIKVCVGIHARFYKGGENLLFPPVWLNYSETLARDLLVSGIERQGKGMGVDPGEGEAQTSITVVDELGICEVMAWQTPDTTVVNPEVIALGRKWGMDWEKCCYDAGGGGKQLADMMRKMGYPVQTVGFGETVKAPLARGHTSYQSRVHSSEERYTYFNRRAQMYGMLSLLVEPRLSESPTGFAIPGTCHELRRQLALIPKIYDIEGRLKLPPKKKRNPHSPEVSLTDIIGCSPDQADSTVLAVYAMLRRDIRPTAGAIG